MWYQVLVERNRKGRVCWVDKKVRQGQYVTFKADPKNEKWFVLYTYGSSTTKPDQVYRVGGL